VAACSDADNCNPTPHPTSPATLAMEVEPFTESVAPAAMMIAAEACPLEQASVVPALHGTRPAETLNIDAPPAEQAAASSDSDSSSSSINKRSALVDQTMISIPSLLPSPQPFSSATLFGPRARSPPPASADMCSALRWQRWEASERRIHGAVPFPLSRQSWLPAVVGSNSRHAQLAAALLRVVTNADSASQHARDATYTQRTLSPPRVRRARARAAAVTNPKSSLRASKPPPPDFPFVPLPPKATSQFLPFISEWQRLLSPMAVSFGGASGGWYRNPAALLQQITDGVSLGYDGDRTGFIIQPNHPSAKLPEVSAVVDKEILDELRLRRMAGPFTEQQVREMFPFFRTSPMAVVPKSDGGWRIIDDLTHEGADLDGLIEAAQQSGDDDRESRHLQLQAVNAHISDEEARVRYHSFDEAVRMVRRLGRGCWLAKVDWKAAFRQIAVCRDDWPLLGLHWRGRLFVRLVLPFGARSSPARFTQFAQAFAGMLRRCNVPGPSGERFRHVMYYLDDFLLADASREECAALMQAMDDLAQRLGVTLHPTKRDGPTQVLTFLGIGIDTRQMRIFLPDDKKQKVKRVCAQLLAAADNGVSLRQLQSAIGLLLHAGRVVQPGRLMTRRLVELMRVLLRRDASARPYERIPLPPDARDDLQWWIDGLDAWDGVSMMPLDDSWTEPIVMQSDASTSEGAGAVLFAPQPTSTAAAAAVAGDAHSLTAWFHYAWPARELSQFRRLPIAALEMAAIAIALNTFGPQLRGRCIHIHSDSANAVANMTRQAPASPLNMRMLRGIHATAWLHDIRIKLTSHIAGVRNVFADAASRLRVQTADMLASLQLPPETRQAASLPEWLITLVASAPSEVLRN
jgi:hypothetical protein